VILLTGWVYARRRTVTGLIMAAQAVGVKHHSVFHRLFARARWSRDALGLAVFSLIVPWTGETVMLALDDTLARKRGRKVFGAGMHHDPLLSSRKTAIVNFGHSWVVLGVLVRLPFCAQRWFCLPILFRLYLNKKGAAKHRRRYRSRPELAVEMLRVLCATHRQRRFHAVADSAYGGQSVLCRLPVNCELTSRLALNARLYEPAPVRTPGTRGRTRKRGPRLPSPGQMLERRCHRRTLALYARHERARIATTTARVYAAPEQALAVVAIEPLRGGRGRQAFYSTIHEATAEQVLAWYAARWAIEVSFHEAKQHLGFEQPQGWTRAAVERTAPTAMLLYRLIVLWFAESGHHHDHPPDRPWYPRKPHAAFADMLATLRVQSVRDQVLQTPPPGPEGQQFLNTLIHVYQQAA
jgi:SRSO17 transposase